MKKKKRRKKKQTNNIAVNGGVAYWQEADGFSISRTLEAGHIGRIWGVPAQRVVTLQYDEAEAMIKYNLKRRKSKKKLKQFILEGMPNNLQALELLAKYKLL